MTVNDWIGRGRSRFSMNALANSQLEGPGAFVGKVTDERPVTFARYTEQEDIEAFALN